MDVQVEVRTVDRKTVADQVDHPVVGRTGPDVEAVPGADFDVVAKVLALAVVEVLQQLKRRASTAP